MKIHKVQKEKLYHLSKQEQEHPDGQSVGGKSHNKHNAVDDREGDGGETIVKEILVFRAVHQPVGFHDSEKASEACVICIWRQSENQSVSKCKEN